MSSTANNVEQLPKFQPTEANDLNCVNLEQHTDDGAGLTILMSPDQLSMEPDKLLDTDEESLVWDLRSESELDSDDGRESESEQDILDHLKRFNVSGSDDCQGCILNPSDINVTFNDVFITPDAIEALDPILLQLQFPGYFQTGILAQNATGLLLYGPPGTGKTQFVRAFAKQADAKILSVSGADFRDCRVGESEKKIQKIFASARAHKGPFVIFIDEADSIFRSRAKENSSTGHVDDVNQFLAEMDGVNAGQTSHVMVIAASNRPFDIDEGILRRLGRRILVNVPDKDGREAILRIHLKNDEVASDVSLSELARRTAGYTGSDLKNLIYEAALDAVREIAFNNRTCHPPIPANSVGQPKQLHWRHFLHAEKQIQASPRSETEEKIREFHNRFGNMAQRRPEKSDMKDQLKIKRKKKPKDDKGCL